MPRGRKGRRRTDQVELTGLDAKIYWENRAALETAQERLWEVHGEVGDDGLSSVGAQPRSWEVQQRGDVDPEFIVLEA
jgi:hypothetical protein